MGRSEKELFSEKGLFSEQNLCFVQQMAKRYNGVFGNELSVGNELRDLII